MTNQEPWLCFCAESLFNLSLHDSLNEPGVFPNIALLDLDETSGLHGVRGICSTDAVMERRPRLRFHIRPPIENCNSSSGLQNPFGFHQNSSAVCNLMPHLCQKNQITR